jgi:WD40 repeat protein
MAYQTDDFSFGFWDIEAGEIVGMPITGPDAVSSALAMNPDDYALVSTTSEGHIVKWDWSPLGELVHEDLAGNGGTILDLEFGSYGLPLISAHDNGALLAWIMTAEGQSVPQTLDMGDSPVLEIAFNADRDLFAAIRMDNTISVWDATNAGAIHKIHEFGGE